MIPCVLIWILQTAVHSTRRMHWEGLARQRLLPPTPHPPNTSKPKGTTTCFHFDFPWSPLQDELVQAHVQHPWRWPSGRQRAKFPSSWGWWRGRGAWSGQHRPRHLFWGGWCWKSLLCLCVDCVNQDEDSHTHACMHTHAHINTHMHAHTHTHTHTIPTLPPPLSSLQSHTHRCMHACTCAHTHTPTHTHSLPIPAPSNHPPPPRVHARTHPQTHTHTHTHTHTLSSLSINIYDPMSSNDGGERTERRYR